jgi:DNA-binding response OmpR family regulator
MIEQKYPDLVLVDVNLPDLSGLDLISRVREADLASGRIEAATPMMVLSGRGAELDLLRGFERGADDYVIKPFSYPELRARVRALLRRTQGRRAAGRWRVGGLVVDANARCAQLHGRRKALTQKEFALLKMLASEPVKVFTKADLLRTIWGHSLNTTRTLDSHACRLRHKLQAFGRADEDWIVNVWGVGYRLLDTPIAEAA